MRTALNPAGLLCALAFLARCAPLKVNQEAIAPLSKNPAPIPKPEYAAALVDVYKKLGRHSGKKTDDLVNTSANHRKSALYNRELAYSQRPRQSSCPKRWRAQNEIKLARIQGTPAAWSLYKNGRAEEAKTAMTELSSWSPVTQSFFSCRHDHKQLGENDKRGIFFNARWRPSVFCMFFTPIGGMHCPHSKRAGSEVQGSRFQAQGRSGAVILTRT